ncbi:Forkhead-associated (FHA) domain-containing protein [Zea mays]|jgi:hypothetical protein|uniref:Forkhead-associated (FHA) domain-containing protein n=1 Tax=Zea mays TaxID=4577 RepID=A0A1D6HUU7_MAIZE|nr:Forkhead-associated (FHA) domain-containing protein [Zea mays]ONM52068.1 Forkhead-associated (FHA) domain-containing protein [Zea mays]
MPPPISPTHARARESRSCPPRTQPSEILSGAPTAPSSPRSSPTRSARSPQACPRESSTYRTSSARSPRRRVPTATPPPRSPRTHRPPVRPAHTLLLSPTCLQQPTKKKKNFGMGLGARLLGGAVGGLLIGGTTSGEALRTRWPMPPASRPRPTLP